MPHPTSLHLLAVAALAAIPWAAQAQEGPGEPAWEVGGVAFAVSQQAYPGSDHQVRRGAALPWLVYRGKVLRAEGDSAGLRAIKTPQFELDIGVAGSFGSNASDIEARRGMPNIGTLVEFGPRLRWNLTEVRDGARWRLDLPLRGVFDLSDSLAHRGFALQPTLVYQWRTASRWNYSVSVSALLADERLAETFYEVSPRHARATRPSYEAEAGLVAWRLGASVSRGLARDWRVFGFARLDTVAGAANRASPLVRQTTGASAGIGLSYTWLRSQAQGTD
jgi:outer membrane scaffolding protein for murein synthesis (MipA/OmpV family)